MPLKKQWIEDDSVEVGIDEAGRGSLWGRLYVGAVILSPFDECYSDNGVLLKEIQDSKKLSARKRGVLKDYIEANAIETAVNYAEPDEIDSINILQADLSAMHRALESLSTPFHRILVDGDQWKSFKDIEAIKIQKGDANCLSIAAASILAKEAHDSWVHEQLEKNPSLHEKYGFRTNMGYGTKQHLEGLKEWGPDSQHRRSFRPVADSIGWIGS